MIPRAMLAVEYATGRASHARQVKGDDQDKKRYPGPPGWGFGVGLTTLLLRNLNEGKRRILFDGPKPTAGSSANGRRIFSLIKPTLNAQPLTHTQSHCWINTQIRFGARRRLSSGSAYFNVNFC
jgi:hypothetical protein